jgi:CRP/FNR family transcriptional regulator
MVKGKSLIEKKFKNYFSKIFEKKLLDEIVEVGIYKVYPKGEMLIDIDQELTHIPLITKGIVKVSREDPNGEEILLYFLERGDTCAISFVNCINVSKSMFRGVIETDVECILVPVNKIEEWLVNYRTWREFIIDSYHNRLVEMVEIIKSLAFFKLDDRLYKYLKDHVRLLHNKKLNITHQEIADDMHTSRVVISRLLKILEKKGKIKLGRKNIHVTN